MRVNQNPQSHHLARNAYLYVRQATIENTNSIQRQYALKERAVALGWPADEIVVIDNDIGKPGASASGRKGFQKLVREVSLGRAGIVMALDGSRFARNLTDWYMLLETCAVTDTLILTDDTIYDPTEPNDMLLLGLEVAMCEV
jgi:DNA invertase Pin-like site-specific DNA recombinase